ncbi:DUF5690 family protein [Dyadobacter tibetensis]|uniref:DUF5690 family protein n=1 Tax=Dyadobacter tibetensis TaxID=1211851 RepID=UPI0004B94E07|nr:DUF5690 family protein [Dyadobacter tibetensis]
MYTILIGKLKSGLENSKGLLILWTIFSSFGVYFCMYSFRKPFSAGVYEGLTLWGVGYKAILIISQLAGYTLSKFIGIKVISELKKGHRLALIIGLILLAHLALLLFAVNPFPYNFIFLFVNGLPLGMVYGVVFSFVEGRRLTELLAMGLSVSVVVASGILKTIYLNLSDYFPEVGEFWMPFLMGSIFLPMFLIFVWMLGMIPGPTEADIKSRTLRVPMTRRDKYEVLARFGFPIMCLVLCYSGLVVVRDFRDNFTVEIWNEIDAAWENGVLAQTELICGLVVFVIIGLLVFVKSNLLGFRLCNLIVLVGLVLCGFSTYLFEIGWMNGFYWMLFLGVGAFLSYTALQTVVFERFIALFRLKANAGYFIYLCESLGYLGSGVLLLFKEFYFQELSWVSVLTQFAYLQAGGGLALLILANSYLEWHRIRRKRERLVFNQA